MQLHAIAKVSGLFKEKLATLEREEILPDRNLTFKDVDPCSSDSELGDIIEEADVSEEE